MLTSTWHELAPKTISNCFTHCFFFEAKCSVEQDEVKQVESDFLENVYENLEREFKEFLPDSCSLLDYVNAYVNTAVCCELNELSNPLVFSEENSKDSGMDSPTLNESLDESQEDEPMSELKRSDAVSYLEGLKLYAAQRSSSDYTFEILQSINNLEKLIFREPVKLVQTKLNFYIN